MPLPGEISPSRLAYEPRSIATQFFGSFDEFAGNPTFYDQVAQLFTETYNSPPWDESWEEESVASYFQKLTVLPSEITTVREGEELIGLFIGCIGTPEKVVPLSVDAYFPDHEASVAEEMKQRLYSGLEEYRVNNEPVFWGCDFAVPHNKRGATVAGKMLRQAITSPIKKGVHTMYGMTLVGSPFHTITERRGSKTILEVSEFLPGDHRIFKVMDVSGLQQ